MSVVGEPRRIDFRTAGFNFVILPPIKTPNLVMRRSPSPYRLIAILIVAVILGASPVLAQEYKETFNAGLEAAKADQLDSARDLLVSAAGGADAEGDTETASRARYIAAQIAYKLGTADLRAEDFESALAHYTDGTELFPNYNKNLYGQGLALKKLGRINDALTVWKAVADSGGSGGDRETINAARNGIRDHFYFQASSSVSDGATMLDAERAREALAALEEFLEPDADYYYYMAEIHKRLGDPNASVAAADQALEMHRGSRSDKAKIWFTKGEMLVVLGNIEAAREAFQNAAVGAYRAPAEHYLETL